MKLLSETTPTRVIVDRDGYAVSPNQAVKGYGMENISVVFVRDDGWSLGAPPVFESIAFEMWQSNWKTFVKDGHEFPISEYTKFATA